MSVCAEARNRDTGTLSSEETKARKAPAATPGMISGSVTRRKVRHGPAPSAALDSSSAGSSPAAEAPTVRSAKGAAIIAWPATRSARDGGCRSQEKNIERREPEGDPRQHQRRHEGALGHLRPAGARARDCQRRRGCERGRDHGGQRRHQQAVAGGDVDLRGALGVEQFAVPLQREARRRELQRAGGGEGGDQHHHHRTHQDQEAKPGQCQDEQGERAIGTGEPMHDWPADRAATARRPPSAPRPSA